jgi:hypothetical protein
MELNSCNGSNRFICVSLGNSIVQLHDNLGSRRACACSEAGFSRQNGDRGWGVYYRKTVFWCEVLGQIKNSMQRIFIEKSFLFMVKSVRRVKRFATGREISSRTFENLRWCPTRTPCWDCDRSNCAAGGRVDSSWQEDNDTRCGNCTRVFPWFCIQQNAWSFEVQVRRQKGYCSIMTIP